MSKCKKNFQVSLYSVVSRERIDTYCVNAVSKDAAIRAAMSAAFGPDLRLNKERPGVVRVTERGGRFTYVETVISDGCEGMSQHVKA